MSSLPFHLVDVFASRPYSGNPLPVVIDRIGLNARQMLQIAREFRQFETAFAVPPEAGGRWRVRIFDLLEELPFAGHPLLGAAAVIRHTSGATSATQELLVQERALTVRFVGPEEGEKSARYWLDAGIAHHAPAPMLPKAELATALGLTLPMEWVDWQPQVVSTGLRYLVVPVPAYDIARARIQRPLDDLLRRCDAQFLVLVDTVNRELRHWNNDGAMEDAATGSAAGVVASWLVNAGHAARGTPMRLHQGRHIGRDSELQVVVGHDGHVSVGGAVCQIGEGRLDVTP
jgi:trans-2,3-dihydro-3-hydroxyanthranilate isomerase